MGDETVPSIERQAVAKLLDRPLGGGVVGEIPLQHPACGDVDEHEHVQALKCDRHDQEEVARENGASMVLEKCCPRLERLAPLRVRGRDGM